MRRRSRLGKKQYRRDWRQDESGRDDRDDSDGHDDTIGSLEGKPGDYIASRCMFTSHRVCVRRVADTVCVCVCVCIVDKIIREAGLGTFGRVLECLDKQRNMVVAIKVVRKVEKYTESAKVSVVHCVCECMCVLIVRLFVD